MTKIKSGYKEKFIIDEQDQKKFSINMEGNT